MGSLSVMSFLELRDERYLSNSLAAAKAVLLWSLREKHSRKPASTRNDLVEAQTASSWEEQPWTAEK
jgi:hypothetical protein